jgi:glycosyltransferase involved in cell wall biosynthesis
MVLSVNFDRKLKSISICHILPTLAYGGTETLLYSIFKHINRQMFEINIFSTYSLNHPSQDILFNDLGIQTFFLAKRALPRIIRIFKTRQFLLQQAYNIVHIHNYEDELIDSRIAAILARIPIIITHDHNTFNIWWQSKKRQVAWRLLNHFTYANVTVSHTVERERRKMCGGQPWKVITILNGIDLDNVMPEPRDHNEAKTTFGIAPNTKVITAVGRLIEWKRFELVLRTASLLKERGGLFFLIVGDGPLQQQLKCMAEELNVAHQLKFLGWVKDMKPVYLASDVLLATSDYCEGFGLAIPEAMAGGIPVVATKDSPTYCEVIGDAGMLVEPEREEIAKAIVRLLDDTQLAAILAERGRKRAEERFDINRTARELGDLYIQAFYGLRLAANRVM